MLEPADTFAPGGRAAPGALHHARQLLGRSSGIGKVLATSVVVRLMALAVPVLTGVVVDRVVPANDGHLLKVLAAVMAALIGYSVIATYLRAHLLLRLRSRLDVDMTLDFLEHLVDLPYAFFLKRSSGDLMMRLRSNATVREILTTGTIAALLDGALATLYLVVIFALSPTAGSPRLRRWVPPRSWCLLAARRRNQHLMGEALATEAHSQSYAYEMFSAVETLKAAGAERRAVSHWTNLFVAELNVSLRRGRLEAVVETAIHGLALLSPIAVLLVGAHLTSSGQLSLGTMLALAALATAFLEPLGILVATALQVQLLGSYLARLDDVFNTPTETAGRELRHAPRTHRSGTRRRAHLPLPAPTAHQSSTAPTSRCSPDRSWPSSGVPARASPRWAGCCWVSTRRRRVVSCSTVSTLPPCTRAACAPRSGWSPRTRTSSGCRSATTSCWATPVCRWNGSSPQPSWPASPTTSARCRWG